MARQSLNGKQAKAGGGSSHAPTPQSGAVKAYSPPKRGKQDVGGIPASGPARVQRFVGAFLTIDVSSGRLHHTGHTALKDPSGSPGSIATKDSVVIKNRFSPVYPPYEFLALTAPHKDIGASSLSPALKNNSAKRAESGSFKPRTNCPFSSSAIRLYSASRALSAFDLRGCAAAALQQATASATQIKRFITALPGLWKLSARITFPRPNYLDRAADLILCEGA